MMIIVRRAPNHDHASADFDAIMPIDPKAADGLYGRGLAKGLMGDIPLQNRHCLTETVPQNLDGFIRSRVRHNPIIP
jgi:hypothetical protein